jgi:hypothetical protein
MDMYNNNATSRANILELPIPKDPNKQVSYKYVYDILGDKMCGVDDNNDRDNGTYDDEQGPGDEQNDLVYLKQYLAAVFLKVFRFQCLVWTILEKLLYFFLLQ